MSTSVFIKYDFIIIHWDHLSNLITVDAAFLLFAINYHGLTPRTLNIKRALVRTV